MPASYSPSSGLPNSCLTSENGRRARCEHCRCPIVVADTSLAGRLKHCELVDGMPGVYAVGVQETKTWSVAEEFGSGDILTPDTNFKVYRWGKNKPFHILL